MTTQMRPEVEFSQRQLLQWPWSSVSSWKGLLVDSWPLGNEVAGTQLVYLARFHPIGDLHLTTTCSPHGSV